MSGNKSKKEDANELLEQLYDSTQADSGAVIVVGGPARDASGTVTRHMRELRDLLVADGLIWETARLSIGITDKGIAQVESQRRSQVLKMEIDAPSPTTPEGIATELEHWVRRQQDGEPGSNHWIQVQARLDHLRYLDGKNREDQKVKSQTPESVKPALPPGKAIRILEDHVAAAQALRAKLFGFQGRQEWTTTAGSILHRTFDAGNPIFSAFSASQSIVWNKNDSQEKLRQIANENLDAQLGVLRSAIQQLGWSLPDSTESFHAAGSPHDAYIEIRALIKTAKTELMIVDAFVDGTLWTLLTNVQPSVKVRVMTENPKPDFALEGKLFISQHGVTVEARKTKSYHDRFIVIDNGTVWHMGTSLNHAGKKAFAFTEFTQPSIRKAVIADIESTWNAASPMTF